MCTCDIDYHRPLHRTWAGHRLGALGPRTTPRRSVLVREARSTDNALPAMAQEAGDLVRNPRAGVRAGR